jgi:membrane-associated protease RseP (regulator of RpoE activity)
MKLARRLLPFAAAPASAFRRRRALAVAAAAGIALALPSVAAAIDGGGPGGSAEIALAPLDSTWRMRLNVESNVRGVVVASIAADSPLARLGIARGDIIEAVNEEAVDTPEQAAALLTQFCGEKRRNGSLSILFNRHGVHRFLVDPGWCRNAASAPNAEASRPAR